MLQGKPQPFAPEGVGGLTRHSKHLSLINSTFFLYSGYISYGHPYSESSPNQLKRVKRDMPAAFLQSTQPREALDEIEQRGLVDEYIKNPLILHQRVISCPSQT